MTPNFSIHNQAYSTRTTLVPFGYEHEGGTPFTHFSDVLYLPRLKSLATAWRATSRFFAENSEGMFNILGAGDIFQISQRIVSLFAVFVIDLQCWGTGTNKSFHNKVVNQESFWLHKMCNCNSWIASTTQVKPQHSVRMKKKRTNSPSIAYFVSTFITNNGKPLFLCHRGRILTTNMVGVN